MLKWYSALSCCFVLLGSGDISAQQAEVPNSAQLEKAYQQVLYEYYQGNFSSALTQMAILEQKFPEGLTHIPDFLSGHQVEPELLKGGMSLAYGLDNQAADIFLRLLKNNTTPEVSAFSWLLLGKTYYQKRQFSDAARAFQNIEQEAAEEYFEQSTRDNWLYMQSQLHGFLLDEDAKAGDVKWLEQLSSDSIYRDYVQYNQALALLQKGQDQQAMSGLSSLANQDSSFVSRWMGWAAPIFSEDDEQDVAAERDAIRDRANLTLGYTLLKNEEPHQAFRVFENIRTQGLDAEAALLGYGWAAAKKNELQTALSIWQRLMHMPQDSEYTLEAYLASAYAYENAFAPRQSMQVLQLGLNRFEQALDDLNQATLQVNQPQFILGLLANDNQPQSELDEQSQPLKNTQLFNSVAVTSEFRAGLSALQESRLLQAKMQNWQQRMQQYHLMLDERQVERLKRAKQILQNRTLEQLAELEVQRDKLALVIETANKQQDGQVFMSQQSQKWLDRVKRSEQRLATIAQLKKQLAQPPLADSYQKRVERVAGRLIWQASEDYSGNYWQAQKALNQLDSEIAKAQLRQQQLLNQLAATPDFTEQRLRVSHLAQRIDAEIDKANELQDALVRQLSGIFSQFIQAHKQKVSNYILQAQLAMVRLSDQALQKDNDSRTLLDDTSANQGDQL